MYKNYFKIAYRNLLRHKVYTFINLAGLAVGMACCLLIAFYVQDELSYDAYHEKGDRMYRVLHSWRPIKQGEAALPPPAPEEFQVWGNAPIAPALSADFPEVQQVVRFTSAKNYLFELGEKRFQEKEVLFMDSTAFGVFSWKLLQGDPQTALLAPNSLVLTKRLAEKYFGDSNPMGQSIRLDNQFLATVTGVMEDVPHNSHFSFDALLSMTTFHQQWPEPFEWWGYVDYYTYFTVTEGTDIAKLQARTSDFLKRQGATEENGYTIHFEPLRDAYLHSQAQRQPGTTGNLSNLYIFASIALFILLIACINFMNLATARSADRAKEVGVRKVIGARQRGLVTQFLTESVLLSLLAGVLAVLLAWLAFPAFLQLSGKSFGVEALLSAELLLLVLAASLLVGILAGSYPAWVLARYRPALVLKGVFSSSAAGIALRKGLVVFQFSLSMALIAGTAIIFSQLNHLRTKELGFRQEQMLVIDFGYDTAIGRKAELMKQRFLQHPAVGSVAVSRSVPGDFIPNAGTDLQTAQGEMEMASPLIYEIDTDFIPHFEIDMVAGRAFSPDFPADTAHALILNEAALQLWGYSNAEDVIGKPFSQWGREGTVVGVVKDFNFRSLHTKVEPLSLRLASPGGLSRFSMRIQSNNLQATLGELEGIWNELAPHYPFQYSFLDESFNQQYGADQRFGQVFSVFAGLAIFIACLGLLGLVTYAAQQRTKEIGIRKVLGASVLSIVSLLSRDFLKLVGVAALIAFPVAWWAMHKWLEDFPYRIDMPLWVFFAAGAMAALVALITISFQAIKAAMANPVKNLRSE
jgi:putative ABC transport system permease protein